ncbi:MAG: N-6 DNA methylase [Bacilli bacterium]|nr:N-6 DNA methylase [Bacilli bacterium]
MQRLEIVQRVGQQFVTSNIEGGEYSYVLAAGSRELLEKAVGHRVKHFKLDIRFEDSDFVVLVETKQSFVDEDEKQLSEYVEEEKALYPNHKIIAILANTRDDKIKVWKGKVDKSSLLLDETVMDTLEHYKKYYDVSFQNDREKVMKNTYELNETLHKMDIDEGNRSQFVGTCLLYIKDIICRLGYTKVDDNLVKQLNQTWSIMTPDTICAAIKDTLNRLLDGSKNKAKKIELLQKNVLEDQKIKKLTLENWMKILNIIVVDIYRYINADSSEGQDILNLFFIAFNKYTGKKDKNQAFTPDHITDFMTRVTKVDRNSIVLDATCGSASFLVQAMCKALADCRRDNTEEEAKRLMKLVKEQHIFGIEVEEKAYGLSTTNMLIHGDGNSNIEFGSCFDCEKFIKSANPDVILMNPPYNAKPISIPNKYKKDWTENAKNGKDDPTKGFVFIQYLSDVLKTLRLENEKKGLPIKHTKMAVLLPVSAAIGTSDIITIFKKSMLKDNTLEAVFTLPDDIFYPGASACACCMVFTLGIPHPKDKETFFGYYKEDGFKKKKNLGRVEQFDDENKSRWKDIEKQWLYLYDNHKVVDGLSATAVVDGDKEWLCEAYMKTDYSKLSEEDFQKTLNNYLAFLVKEGKVYES